jgi:DnaJ-class molecular chaperone
MKDKMKKKYKIIEKYNIMDCWKCNGEGWIYSTYVICLLPIIICSTCHGTGKWSEKHYIIIDLKNKIAMDSDNIG